jgi:peptidoglycan/xylan/chitin deacetylase (PgdA/CDA1 family)
MAHLAAVQRDESFEGVGASELAARFHTVEPSPLRLIASKLLRQLGLRSGVMPALARLRRRGAVVLMYHNVLRSPFGPWGESQIDVQAFEGQCRFLAREANVVPLRDLVAHVRDGGPLPPRAVVLTFDDGYRNNLVLAAPILRRYRLPAVFFVATAFCGSEQWMWCSEVEELARRHRIESLCAGLDDEVVGRIAAARIAPRSRTLMLIEYLKRLRPVVRDRILSAMRRGRAVPPDDDNRFLSWQEVRALHAEGFEIGSHTVNHSIMTMIDADDVDREVVEAKRTIEREVGRAPDYFCYPNGDMSPAVRAIVRRHHAAAVSVEVGEVRRGADLFALRRVGAPLEVRDLAYQLAMPSRG